ncbi:hypothetical protein JZ751_022319, partial [Albula glossodonta]
MRQTGAELPRCSLLLLPLLLSRLAAKQVLRYRAVEEGPANLPIGNVAADLGIGVGSGEVSFSLESGLDYLRIDNITGQLSTGARRIDREALAQCQKVFDEKECFLDFEVSVIGPAQSWVHLFEGRVIVQDINDNAPSFPSPLLSLSVEENRPIGTLYLLPTATDRDFGQNGVQRYELLAGAGRSRGRGRSSVFELQVADTPEGKQPQLIVKGDLDRERRDAYELILRARDGGDPPKSAEATLRVRAWDADAAANGQVEYALAAGSEAAGRFLRIDPGSGWISILRAADRERTAQLHFSVTAQDHGLPPRSASTSVLLHVLDRNDNTPTVEIRKIGRIPLRAGVARVMEDVAVDTPVALVQVWDPDEGRNGEVTCTLVGDAPFRLKPVGGEAGGGADTGGSARGWKYLLHTAEPLDFETAQSHQVWIVAVDAGSPSLAGNASVTVEVGDVNEHAPLFQQGVIEAAVPENSPPGEPVLRVKAWDRDVLVLVRVLDRNDNTPLFLPRGPLIFHTPENVPPDMPIAMVTAMDADEGQNANLHLFITLGEEEEGLFFISNTTGAIFSRRSLDRERRAVHRFGVTAVDGGTPPLSCSATVTLIVTDDNDNPPTVVSPDNTSFALLPPSSPPGVAVATVVAVDADEGRNAEMRFELLEGNPWGLFRVEPEGGAVRLAAPLQRKHLGLHRLVLRVSDCGAPPLHAITFVHVYVNGSVSNASVVRAAVARSQEAPLGRIIAGKHAEEGRGQRGIGVVIGAMAGGAALLLLVILVTMAIHCDPTHRKGYEAGRREPPDQQGGAGGGYCVVLQRVSLSLAEWSQDPGGYDSGVEESESDTPSSPPPFRIAPPGGLEGWGQRHAHRSSAGRKVSGRSYDALSCVGMSEPCGPAPSLYGMGGYRTTSCHTLTRRDVH